MTMNGVNTTLNAYKPDVLNYTKDASLKEAKSKGNKTARSPGNIKSKKKNGHKHHAIYNILCEKVKVLQITSQKLFEKNQRLKEYEKQMNAKFEERERQLLERENRLNLAEQDKSLKRSLKTDDLFDYGARQEYSEIMQQLKSIDTRKTPDDMVEDIWDIERPKSPNLLTASNQNNSHRNNFNILRSLEPQDFIKHIE